MLIRTSLSGVASALLLVAGSLITGCEAVHDESLSDPKVTNGQAINEDQYPAVVSLASAGLCTGTFVSDTTLITAAHCVTERPTLRTRSVRVDSLSAVSQQVFVHPRWNGQVGPSDLAVVVFAPGTSKVRVDVAKERPRAGSPITIIGYGKSNHFDDSTAGRKRMGRNVLQAAQDGVLQFSGELDSRLGGTGERSASSNGDSGGPMLVNDKLVGVTSGGFDSGPRKYSIYVDLLFPSNLQFLQSTIARGAKIPSLTGDDDEPQADKDLFVALGEPEVDGSDFYRLHVSTSEKVDRVRFCVADGPSLCLGDAPELTTASAIPATFAGRHLFRADDSTELKPGLTLSIVGLTASGELVSLRAVRFDRL